MPLIPREKKGVGRMHSLLFFIIGTLLGGIISDTLMCPLQINRLSKREDGNCAETKRPDTSSP